MRRLLKALSFCVLLLWAAVPAAAVACQWSCTVADPQGGHVAHHQPAAHAGHDAHDGADSPSLSGAPGSACDHLGSGEPAVAAGAVKLASPVATIVSAFRAPLLASPAALVAAVAAAPSPPGARSGPLPLRI